MEASLYVEVGNSVRWPKICLFYVCKVDEKVRPKTSFILGVEAFNWFLILY